jgi:competence protein ComEA
MKALSTLGKVVIVAAFFAMAGFVQAAPVNVNTADAQALAENIKGIGPKKAQAIVNYRNQYGPFKSIEDLMKVKGIGQKIVDLNKSDLLFSEAANQKGKQSAKN